MKAVVCDRYGPPEVLRIEEVARPAPRGDELLVLVRAATVNRLDCHTREANRSNGLVISGISRVVSGLRRPRQPVLGTEFAGEVAAAGPAVTRFGAGDRVFGNTGLRFGCHAEFTCVPEAGRVAAMPGGLGFGEAAAATDGALNALWCLRLAGPLEGRRVLVYGASGAIGTAAVQVAKFFGAQVTAVCGPRGVGVVQAIGADRVIDYTKQDFTADRGRYFSVFDAVGKESFARCRGVIEPGGTYLATDGLRNLLLALWTSRFGDRKVMFKLPPRYTQEDVVLIGELMEAGSYRPVIDRVYPLEAVAEAARYVETQQKIGNVLGSGRFEVEAGFPVSSPVEPSGDVQPSELPGGQAAVTVHVGPYDQMEPAYQALASWVTDHGGELAGDAWEVFFSDPATEPDPATWRTEVVQPYRQA